MKIKEMKEIVLKKFKELSWNEEGEWYHVGLRFEDKEREVGEEIEEKSRNNINREDEREFPKYGTDEYFELEEMDGISTWDLSDEYNLKWIFKNPEKEAQNEFIGKHCYIIVGNKVGWEQMNGIVDDGELLISDPIVAYKVY